MLNLRKFFLLSGICVWGRFFGLTYTVSNTNDAGAGSLRQALIDLQTDPGPSATINFTISNQTITLTSGALPNIRQGLLTGTVTINGNSNTVNAGGFRAFVIGTTAGAQITAPITIHDLTVTNGIARGGNGGLSRYGGRGGGGMGAGGAYFVNGNLTLDNGAISGCSAIGGSGSPGEVVSDGGAGGGGASFCDSGATVNGVNGAAVNGGGGGGSNSGLGGVGAAGTAGGFSGGGGGGAGGYIGVSPNTRVGAAGGFGAGGGGGGDGGGGNPGAFGGAGGGFGGGGGGAGEYGSGPPKTGGAASTYGGAGGGTTIGGGDGAAGGGGAGIGGCIFVYTPPLATPSILTLTGNSTNIAPGTVAGGAGANAGTGLGLGVFLFTSSQLVMNGTFSTNFPIDASPLIGADGGVTISGGVVTINTVNSYRGGTFFNGGTARVAADSFLGEAAGNLTFNGGTLQIDGAFTSPRNTLINAAGGTIAVSIATDTFNMSGLISGAGSLTKTLPGTLVLSNGLNSYVGGTAMNGGVVQVTLDGQLGNAAGGLFFNGGTLECAATFSSARPSTFTGDGTIQVDPTFFLTLTGGSMGAGSLTKTGTGTLVISTASFSHTGGTTISTGMLSFGAGGSLSSTGSVDVDAGALFDVNALGGPQTIGDLSGAGNVSLGATLTTGGSNASTTFSGIISGAGGLVKQGTGTFILTGLNTYLGGTTVSDGTLAGNTSTLPCPMINNSNLRFDQIFPASYPCAINGTGNLIVEGGGLLNLVFPVTQNAVVVSNGGMLAVNTPLTSTAPTNGFTVNAGCLLQGIGPITSDVDIFGTLSPGNSIGTMHIIGDVTFQLGSQLLIEMDPTTADLLNVTGSVTIVPGSTIAIFPVIGVYSPFTTYTIVDATGSTISGTFTTESISLPSFIYDVVYPGDRILLTLGIVPFSDLPLSGSATAVAQCLSSANAAAGSDLADNIITSLRFMTLSEMENTMNQMSPAIFNGLDCAEEVAIEQVIGTLSRQMHLLSPRLCNESPQKMRIWNDAFVASASQKGSGQNVGYDAQPIGDAAGVDFLLGDSSFLGVSIGYVQNQMHWKEQGGSGRMHNAYASLYSKGWISSQWYAQGALIGSLNTYDIHRSIAFIGEQFSPFQREASSQSSGQSCLSHFETGYSFGKEIQGRAFSRADYAFIHRSDFTENGADSINLRVNGHNADLLRMEVGIEILHCFIKDSVQRIPSLACGGIYEGRYMGRKETASFVSLDCPMTVNGLIPNQFLFFVEGNVIWQSSSQPFAFGGNVRGEWGSKFSNISGSLQLKLRF